MTEPRGARKFPTLISDHTDNQGYTTLNQNLIQFCTGRRQIGLINCFYNIMKTIFLCLFLSSKNIISFLKNLVGFEFALTKCIRLKARLPEANCKQKRGCSLFSKQIERDQYCTCSSLSLSEYQYTPGPKDKFIHFSRKEDIRLFVTQKGFLCSQLLSTC